MELAAIKDEDINIYKRNDKMKKIYVVFGGSGGIGFECAKLFNDGHVIIADVNEATLDHAKSSLEKLNIEAHSMKCDLTNKEDVAKVAEFVVSLGELGTVINTAGLSAGGPNVPLIMKVNLVGSAIIVNEFLPHATPGMTMVCLASMLGYVVPRNEVYDGLLKDCLSPDFMEIIGAHLENSSQVAYRLSKYGVHRLCEKQALAWGQKGARILSVSPGVIETPMAKESPEEVLEGLRKQTPMGRNGHPEEVAKLIAFLCSDDASFITGCDVRIDGGLVHHLS